MINITPQEVNKVVKTFNSILEYNPTAKTDFEENWKEVCRKTAQMFSSKSDLIYESRTTKKEYRVLTSNLKIKIRGNWEMDLVLFESLENNPDGRYFAMERREFYTNFIPL